MPRAYRGGALAGMMRLFRKPEVHLRTRIFFVFSLLLVTALVVTCAANIILMQNLVQQDYIAANERDMALVSNVLQSKLTHLSDYAISIASDSRVIEIARRYPDGPVNLAEQAALRQALGRNVRTIIGVNTDLYMYDIYSLKGDGFGISGYDLERLRRALGDDFFEDAARSLSPQISGPYGLRYSVFDVPVFIITKAIVNLDTREPYGILMFVIRETTFSKEYSNGAAGSGVDYYVVDGDMNIVSAADDALLSENVREVFELSEHNLGELSAGRHCTARHRGEETLFMYSDRISRRADWRVFTAVSLRAMHATCQQTIGVIVMVAAVAMLALLLISYRLALGICEPINSLAQSFSRAAESGEMHTVSNPDGSYEINLLYDCFNNLASHMQALILHINQEQEEKSNYQFQLIQAQIKPHFLYNTLMTIKSLIDLDMEDTAGECIYAMSSFYRLSLNRGNDILSVRDEIELSQQYMYIQKLRYIDRLDYVFDIPPSLHDCLIPKMTIQPLLENAIYHGVKEKAGRGVVEVIGKDLGDAMTFSIYDNGTGIDPESLEQLRAYLASDIGDTTPRNASFGMYSVNRRIHLLYGSQYGLRVDSAAGEYTIITLNLPKQYATGGEPS